jgi:hypothetical protein
LVLSPEEVTRFLDAAPGPKYKAAFSAAYGAGRRVSEVVALKASDVDPERNGGRAENIARARQLLNVPAAQCETGDADATDDGEPQVLSHPCPGCGGRMVIIETFERGGAPRYRPTAWLRIDSS